MRTAQLVHWDKVPKSGLPSEVMHADEVCTSEQVTAFTAIILTSLTMSARSAAASEEKIILVASGANANSNTAHGRESASVYMSAFFAIALASRNLPAPASGEIFGTLAAASP